MSVAGDAEQAARALIQPIDGVIIKRCRILTEQGGKLFAQRAGVDMAAGERRQRRALADDNHILVDIADEGRRQAFHFAARPAVCRRALFAAVFHADFEQLARAQKRVRAEGLAVAEDTALHLEPPKRVRAQPKPSGNDAARRAARVLFGGDIGQNAHEKAPQSL